MSSKEISAETAAQQIDAADVTRSTPTCSNTIVSRRYFIDERVGCIAVRDRLHPKYEKDYPGLHFDTVDVVYYLHGENSKDGWNISEWKRNVCQKKCDDYNEQYADVIDKIETLNGYLKAWVDGKSIPLELHAVVDEVSGWVARNGG